jgi:hypothetical protein
MASIGKKGVGKKEIGKKERVFELVIIEDSIDDLSERRLQFLSSSEAFRTIQETVKLWRSYSWTTKLPPAPSYEHFLECIEKGHKTVYEIGSIGRHGFHLEIQIGP